MPSTYAHFRLGCEAERLLPESLKTLADDNFDCFALGLHGPDLLFYYKPLTNNPTNAIGYAIHENTPRNSSRRRQRPLKRAERGPRTRPIFWDFCATLRSTARRTPL